MRTIMYRANRAGSRPGQATVNRFLRLSKTSVIGFTVFVVLLTCLPLTDPDYFWHLKTGEYIVTHAALPPGDIFSFTRAGQPWVLHEWLFEALLYSVFAGFGELGVRILSATLAVAALALVFMVVRRLAGVGAAWTPLAIGAVAFASGISPRPQLLTYLCFAIFLSVLLRFKYERITRPLFLLPFVMVVWVNAHAAYAVGIGILLLFSTCEWLTWTLQPTRDPEQKRRLVRLTQAVCLVVLASLVNPGLFERWLYPFQVLGMAVNQVIQEWQSPNFHDLGPKAYLGLVLLFLVSAVYAARKPDLTELALPLFFAVQGCISSRHVPLGVLALVPFTALMLARGPLVAMRTTLLGAKPVRWYMAHRDAGKELGASEYAINWLVVCVVALCLPPYMRSVQADPGRQVARVLPEGAADFVAAQAISGRLFNEYADGGYLIYRLAPRAKVVVDGRADVYGDQFIRDYLQIYMGAADWRAKFDRLAVDLALLPLDAPIRQLLLEDSRFREVYRDKHFSVLQRNAPRDSVPVTAANGRGAF